MNCMDIMEDPPVLAPMPFSSHTAEAYFSNLLKLPTIMCEGDDHHVVHASEGALLKLGRKRQDIFDLYTFQACFEPADMSTVSGLLCENVPRAHECLLRMGCGNALGCILVHVPCVWCQSPPRLSLIFLMRASPKLPSARLPSPCMVESMLSQCCADVVGATQAIISLDLAKCASGRTCKLTLAQASLSAKLLLMRHTAHDDFFDYGYRTSDLDPLELGCADSTAAQPDGGSAECALELPPELLAAAQRTGLYCHPQVLSLTLTTGGGGSVHTVCGLFPIADDFGDAKQVPQQPSLTVCATCMDAHPAMKLASTFTPGGVCLGGDDWTAEAAGRVCPIRSSLRARMPGRSPPLHHPPPTTSFHFPPPPPHPPTHTSHPPHSLLHIHTHLLLPPPPTTLHHPHPPIHAHHPPPNLLLVGMSFSPCSEKAGSQPWWRAATERAAGGWRSRLLSSRCSRT